MPSLFRQITCPDGVTINIHDLTRIYFGDYFLVKLEICCEIPSGKPLCDAGLAPATAEGPDDLLTYRRYMQKMGVPSADVEAVKHSLVTDFEANSLPYILSPDFPARFIASRQSTARKPVMTYMEKKF